MPILPITDNSDYSVRLIECVIKVLIVTKFGSIKIKASSACCMYATIEK